jgi:hypothetical protein
MKKRSLLQNVMNYGLITGLIIVAYSLLIYIIGQSLNQALSYVTFIILAACIYLFTKQYRDKENDGFLPYGKGFNVGLLTGLFAGILLAFFTYIEITLIDPTIIDKQLDLMQQKLLQKGMPEDQVEQMMEMSKKYTTPGKMFFSSIVSFTFWSALISLITAALLKKEPSPFDTKNTIEGNNTEADTTIEDNNNE